jgi:hypothetical protein
MVVVCYRASARIVKTAIVKIAMIEQIKCMMIVAHLRQGVRFGSGRRISWQVGCMVCVVFVVALRRAHNTIIPCKL